VTMYLTEPAIDAVLRVVAATGGNEIVLSFAPREPASPQSADPVLPTLAQLAASVGEPWLTYFTPEALEAKLRTHGFRDVDFLTPERAARYFAGRTDGLEPPRRVSVVSARL
jgi:O-methyltransferase involved in polyketide biosynthesis